MRLEATFVAETFVAIMNTLEAQTWRTAFMPVTKFSPADKTQVSCSFTYGRLEAFYIIQCYFHYNEKAAAEKDIHKTKPLTNQNILKPRADFQESAKPKRKAMSKSGECRKIPEPSPQILIKCQNWEQKPKNQQREKKHV